MPESRSGSEEVKESAFFAHTNWDNVLAKKLKPPLIPPRGEVNAADAFDIGSFDEDDTKKIKLSEADQKVYKSFNLLVPDRWQAEMMEGVFGSVNSEKDKQEEREKQKCQRAGVGYYNPDLTHRDSLIQGYCHKLGGMSLLHQWQRKFLMLYPNRLEWSDSIVSTNKANVLAFDMSVLIEEKEYRGLNCIRLQQVGSRKEHWIRFEVSL
jgi:beta-adrenergic-receptor kinase